MKIKKILEGGIMRIIIVVKKVSVLIVRSVGPMKISSTAT